MKWFQVYPLPADHWINTPLAAADHKTLLHLALEAGAGHAEQLARLLVTAGARADLHNEDLGLSPVHVAAQDWGALLHAATRIYLDMTVFFLLLK